MNDEQLEKLVSLMDLDRDLSDEELAALLADEESQAASQDALAMQGAVRAKEGTAPDVDQEWERLSQRIMAQASDVAPMGEAAAVDGSAEESTADATLAQRHALIRPLWWKVAAIAVAAIAVLALLLVYPRKSVEPRPQGMLVAEHAEEASEATLETASGKAIDLKAVSVTATMDQAKEQVLDYTAAALQALSRPDEVETHTLTIPAGKDMVVRLADGTQVWLYPGSRLVYPNRFVGKERTVALSGEAYFKVTKDAQHPFVIHTEAFEARVLGTELDVRTGAAEGHVALLTGKVAVMRNATGENITLEPGQGVAVSNDGLWVSAEDMDRYESWKNGYLYFDDQPLAEIVKAVGGWYNLGVVIQNKNVINKHITYMCLRSGTVDKALELLNSYGSFKVVKEGNYLIVK